jgi:quinoprotein glucose dehydrogenase
MRLSRLVLLVPIVSFPFLALAAPEVPKSDYDPPLAMASDDAQKAIPRFQRDKSLKIEVWAAEPMLANPVAFAFDEKGVCYVAETFRMHHGVTDTRGHMYWLDDDLACRTVADRVAKYKKHAGKKFHETYEKDRERIRRLEDTNGDGKADRSTVFRDDFGRAEDGVGAGLLARKGNVYFTCVPDLWLLKDAKGTGTADVKQSLSTGYGVHTAFIGHDLHGLCVGPDGGVYFSIGDRGLNVKTKEGKHLYCPDSGAVLRCELDGSNLEIFATGLRNPQELAFDDLGNLFTVDNNSDSGDQARFVHIVEGGDSGWRIGYQYETRMHDSTVKQGNRGPWNYEQLWTPKPDAAYIVPPIRNFSNGPSGFVAYPGVGLSDKYKGHFFLANFSGGPGNSGIFSFGIKPKGASFEMTGDHKFVWDVLATDCEFGPDGAFYISDWVDGWNINGKGRIYKVTDPESMKDPGVAEAKKLLAEGMEKKSIEQLVKLLAHPHRGVRLEAQFSLAAKGVQTVTDIVRMMSLNPEDRVARLHGVWALAMIAKNEVAGPYKTAVNKRLEELLSDRDPQVRAQAAKSAMDAGAVTYKELLPLLRDAELQVRMAAALAIAMERPMKGDSDSAARGTAIRDGVFTMLRDNSDGDAYLRHAAAETLAKQLSATLLLSAVDDKSPAIRLGVVVALRRQKSPEIAAFLADGDPKIVAEAARAINDEVIVAALPKLANLLTKPDLSRVVAFRALNAHFLLGQRSNAEALAAYGARSDAPTTLRALAVQMLGDWPKPPRRDYITGLTQDLPPRAKDDAIVALSGVLDKVFAGPDALRKEVVAAVKRLDLKKAAPHLIDLVGDAKAVAQTRIDALSALAALGDSRQFDAARTAVASDDPNLRSAGRGLLYRSDPAGIMNDFRAILAGTNTAEQQGTLTLLAQHPSTEADALIEEWLDKVIANTAKPELALEILEAAAASKSERIKRRLAGYENARAKEDLGKYREALAGGNPFRGKEIFLNKAEVQCQRCHTLGGQGGEVGPPANGAGKQTREYLLEAIVLPNKTIAKGYESVLITTLDNKTVSGVLKGEDDKEVRLMTVEGKSLTVLKSDIDDRRATKSAMPDDLAPKLTKRELRDLVEFLSRLKDDWKKP